MDALQESIIAEAEMMDLLADPNGALKATIIEARTVPGIGACATAIVLQGTLRPGSFCATETTYTRVRSLTNTSGTPLSFAGPSQPCEISGWKDSILPLIGSTVVQFATETECKKFVSATEREAEFLQMQLAEKDISKRESMDRQLLKQRKERARDLSLKPIHILSYDSLQDTKSKGPTVKVLQVLIHSDVTGSLEALSKAIKELPQGKVKVNIISTELGPPTMTSLSHLNSVETGTNSAAALIAFNVNIPKAIEKSLLDRNVRIINQPVIYHLLDEVKTVMASLLPPIETETVQGLARILQLFPHGREAIAGCSIDEGLFLRSQADNIKYILERSSKAVWTGPIKTLKHLKKDITQAQKGMECGIVLDGLDPNLLQVNDIIKCIKIVKSSPVIE